ncbi:hypothetical protein Patl1_35486 [Pistacia atlantica]|nr:hypothetical protein Patl1_35486 [Pistacia atlantica]
MEMNFFKAISLLQQPFEQLPEECHPNCIVVDMLFTWASDSAAKFGIPRLCFHGIGFFPLCVYYSLRQHQPYKIITSDFEPFTVPGLPDQITLTRSQLTSYELEAETQNELLTELVEQAIQAEITSYGIVVNSFYELEPAYSDLYRKVMGRKAWHIGLFHFATQTSMTKHNEEK